MSAGSSVSEISAAATPASSDSAVSLAAIGNAPISTAEAIEAIREHIGGTDIADLKRYEKGEEYVLDEGTMTTTYSIEASQRDGVEIVMLRHHDAVAEIAPALGNNCFMFRVGRSAVLEPVPFGEFLKKPTSYGMPILFPYPNRIAGGAFRFRGKGYPVNPNRHGYVRDKAWKLVATGAAEADGAWMTATLDSRDYPDTILKQFPFPFLIGVTYRLRENVLVIEADVRNVGETVLPFGFGVHPYFCRPEQGALHIPAGKRWELSDNLPTGALLNLSEAFDLRGGKNCAELSLDDIYTDLIADVDGNAVCSIDDRGSGFSIKVSSSVLSFPHIVAYTTPSPRRAICIEPYTCPTNGFNLQERGIDSNIIVLERGETRRLSIEISAG